MEGFPLFIWYELETLEKARMNPGHVALTVDGFGRAKNQKLEVVLPFALYSWSRWRVGLPEVGPQSHFNLQEMHECINLS